MLSHLRNQLGTIGRYRVLERLGRGGMGEVYLAEDPTLRRQVAIKLLAEEFAGDPQRRHRFVREAVAASALTHPHVAIVYEAGETADGEAFICMEYVAGETLASRLARGRLPIADAVRITREIADALDEAHRHGIVHRDIKPANVMIDDRGRVKVVDFGIAKVAEPISTNFPTATRETGTGVIIGTLQYMSPEQKSGGRVDHRSDIFSLGVVMSEMMPDPPSALRRIMQKCMEKDPERRYQSARELLNDLDAVGKRRLPLVASLVAIAIIAVVAAAFLLTRRTPSTPITIPAQRPTNRSVAVLPFVNMSADTSNAFIADGMTEEIINALAQVPSLHVVSRTSSFAFKGQNADIRTIGSKLGVTSVVEGSVQRAGDRLRVTAQLINVDNGYHLWSEHYDRNVDDIFAVQDEIARAVAAALRARVGSTVVQAPTRDLVAYEAYLKGRQAAGVWTRQNFDRALANYRQAIDRDPSFAAAYAGLAELYSLMDHRAGLTTLPTSETYRLAIEAAQKSLSIDPGSAEAHGALGHIYMHLGRLAEADEHLRRSLALNPSSAMSHAWFAVLRRAQLRCDEAAAELSTALQLDPLNVLISSVGAANFLLCGDYEHSAAEARRGLQNDPENGDLLIAIGRAEMLQGHYDAARRALDDAERVAERGSSVEEHRALLLILEGKTREGLAELHRIEREKKAPGPEFIARAYAAAGDIDDALRWLERLIRERPNYARISIDLPPHPAFAALRKDPRYIALRRQLGLPD